MFYREHPRITVDVGTISRTKQSHKQECDINHILSQYQRTGIITHVQNARPQYLDLPSQMEFQESLLLIQESERAFQALPSVVRDHFSNSPEKFLASLNDPTQADKLREFGVLKPLEASGPPSADLRTGAPAPVAPEAAK